MKRVMRNRARRIELDPEIEENCVTDLGRYCSDHEKELGKGDVSIISIIMPFIYVLFRNSMCLLTDFIHMDIIQLNLY